jgi:hypothetical protein
VDASVRRLRFPKGTSGHDEARNLCGLWPAVDGVSERGYFHMLK